MKKINTWNEANKTIVDSETPFMEIDIEQKGKKHTIRLYWTRNRGMYGFQVVTFIYSDVSGKPEVYTEKTNGCGYNKKADALTNAFHFLKVKVDGYEDNSENLPYQYRQGGNYWKISDKETRERQLADCCDKATQFIARGIVEGAYKDCVLPNAAENLINRINHVLGK